MIDFKEDDVMSRYSSSYCKGNGIAKVAFVFICPGQEEQREGKPVAGQTGKNLEILLSFLNKSLPNVFPSTNRYDYRILNLSVEICYKEKNERTIPKISSIRAKENIERIIQEIGDCEIIIFFSKNKTYNKVIKKIKRNLKPKHAIQSRHLGFQSINRGIRCDKSGNELVRGDKGNTPKRLEVIAEKIKKELKK
ncbi:hypothetical protein HCG68_13060 [Paeniclostridium sordellii]|nr:hypothetical protein [Paeniclostridium sordellii]